MPLPLTSNPLNLALAVRRADGWLCAKDMLLYRARGFNIFAKARDQRPFRTWRRFTPTFMRTLNCRRTPTAGHGSTLHRRL